MRAALRALISCTGLAVLLASQAALAAPTDPVVVTLPDDAAGPIQSAGTRLVANLQPAYVESEFFVSGNATVFTYEQQPRRGVVVPLVPDVPYTTRIITRTPADPAQFNGTVVIEWLNSTAGFDTAPVWDISAEYFARRGIAWVGVTNSTTSIGFLVNGCSPLVGIPPTCGTRYASLRFPDNGQAFEMLSQIATLVRRGSNNPLPAAIASRVKRVFHAGQSQQGGSVIAYASNFHFSGNDGYFVQAAINARPLNFQPACGGAGAPAYPACTPRLTGPDSLVVTDLPVPIVQSLTETDLVSLAGPGGRQPATRTFRYYEMAGTAHTPVHKNLRLFNLPFEIASFCALPLNTTADGPVFGSFLINAMWNNLEQQVRFGLQPPEAAPFELADDGITPARDAFGNVRGGLRLPTLDVPVASYGGVNQTVAGLPDALQAQAQLFCRLSGTVAPFSEAQLAQLYPTRGSFEIPFRVRTVLLQLQRFLLPEDAVKLLVVSGIDPATPPPCGRGAELALILPALLGAQRLGRRRGWFSWLSRR